MAIYLIIFFASTFLIYLSEHECKKLKGFLVPFALFLLILLAALRHETVGTDVLYYGKPIYEAVKKINDWHSFIKISTLYEVEYGYIILNLFVEHFFSNFQVLLFCIEFIIVLFTYKAVVIVPYNNKWELMLIFDLLFYNQSLNNLRQFMAMSIMLYAFCEVIFNKKNKYFLLIFLAAFFHKSVLIAIGFFLLYVVYSRKNGTKWRFVFYLLIIIAQVGLSYIITAMMKYDVFGLRYKGHLNEMTNKGIDFNIYLVVFEIIPIVILLLILFLFNRNKNKNNNIEYEILVASAVISIVFNIAYREQFVERIIWYANYITFIIGIPCFIMQLKSIKHIFVIKAYIYISFFCFWLMNYIVLHNCATYPYLPYWGK